ncbi:hypothetical protein D9615_007467 [Tricholomella constricta]|uniref:Reverse transcriptase domain-containing protein n=1 Tax=Tricholomella constricta TaxID=117010 RepID=A0A8H5GYK1_9AGAR|nr:hypothetical protein D9615_007467 [Tricholomella constricta]
MAPPPKRKGSRSTSRAPSPPAKDTSSLSAITEEDLAASSQAPPHPPPRPHMLEPSSQSHPSATLSLSGDPQTLSATSPSAVDRVFRDPSTSTLSSESSNRTSFSGPSPIPLHSAPPSGTSGPSTAPSLSSFPATQVQAAQAAVLDVLHPPIPSSLPIPTFVLDSPVTSLPASPARLSARAKAKGRAHSADLGPDFIDKIIASARPMTQPAAPAAPSRPSVHFSGLPSPGPRAEASPASTASPPPSGRLFTEDELAAVLRAYGEDLLRAARAGQDPLRLDPSSDPAVRTPSAPLHRNSNGSPGGHTHVPHCHGDDHAPWCSHSAADRQRASHSQHLHRSSRGQASAPYPPHAYPRNRSHPHSHRYPASPPTLPDPFSVDSSLSDGDPYGEHGNANDFTAELNANEIVTPDRVVRILRGGWQEYIPLDALTNEACRSASFAPQRQDDASIALNAGGRLQLRSSALDCSRELKIPILGWMQATRNFVDAIKYHYHCPTDHRPGGVGARRIASAFKGHYRIILRRPDFESNFLTYVEYDIFIRRQFLSRLHSGRPMFSVDQFHESVYQTYDHFFATPASVTLPPPAAPPVNPTPAGPALAPVEIATLAPFAACAAAAASIVSPSAPALRNTSSKAPTAVGPVLPVVSSASDGTVPPPVPNPTALMSTAVRSAELLSMVRNSALSELHLPISTPLRPARWAALLQETGGLPRFLEVPKGLTSGFSLGLENFALDHTYNPPNHYKSPSHHAFVVSKLSEEIRLGRLSHGYPPSLATQLFGHYRTAPLNVIERTPGKLRITVDHSYPRGNPLVPSVNSCINAKHFQCAWGTFSSCYLLVADAPEGTEACVFDVDSAFRNIPTRPIDRTATAIMLNGLIHLDGRLNFGICPAPGIFGLVADAIVWIYLHKGIDAVIKWVDDFIFFRYPKSRLPSGDPIFSYDESIIWSIASDLGWPWAKDKFVPFATSFTYIGFEWSLSLKSVRLPDAKRAKYLTKLAPWTIGSFVSLIATDWLPPPSLQIPVDRAIRHAWQPSTTSAYSRGVRDFFDFCDREKIPLSACIPASEALLCTFAASFGGSLSGGTIRSKCSALRSWHIQNSLPWLGGTQLAYVIKGCENMRPAQSFIAKRAAFSLVDLTILLETLDSSSPLDACVAFVASAAFWGQLRLGELLPSRETHVPKLSFPSWSDLKSPNAAGSRVLHLPHSKTKGNAGENVILTRQHLADPIACLDNHFLANEPPDRSHPLAAYKSVNGTLVTLSKRKFLARCNAVFASRRLPAVSGHCFRISGTTQLLLAGVPPDIVKVMGRWTSDSFLRYWRSLDVLAPMYMELLAPLFNTTASSPSS